jgi:hypothetical protein
MVENSEVVIIYPDNLILGDLKYFQYETLGFVLDLFSWRSPFGQKSGFLGENF